MAWHPIRKTARSVVDALDRRAEARGESTTRPAASRWALSGVGLFDAVPSDQLDALFARAKVTELEVREPVVVTDDAVHIVSTGGIKLARVSALGRQLIVGILGPGDLFGRVTASEVDESYVLEALEPSEVVALPADELEGLLGRSDFAYRVVQQLEERERQLVRRVESLVFKDARTRLIETLLALADEHGESCSHGMAVDMRVNQQDLADLIGASRQIVNKLLGELSRSLHVRRMGKVLCILNRRRLERLVSTS
jgi:CRP-like cAMP-binding protein